MSVALKDVTGLPLGGSNLLLTVTTTYLRKEKKKKKGTSFKVAPFLELLVMIVALILLLPLGLSPLP